MNSTVEIPSQTFFIFVITIESLCVIIGVTGNLFVILHNVRWNTDKNTSSYVVINLAVSDLVVCGISFPLYIVEASRVLMGNTEKSDVSCQLNTSIFCATVSLSFLNLMMLTIDRYICIALPLKYPHIVTQRKVSVALVSVWITGFLSFIMMFFTARATDVPLICEMNKIMASVVGFFFFYVPLGVTIVFNVKTVKIARNQGRKIAAQASSLQTSDSTSTDDLNSRKNFTRQLKLFKTIRVVFGCFLFCVSPFPVIGFVEFIICNRGCIPPEVIVVLLLLAGLNSIINPFIYGIRDKEYRRSFKQMLVRCCNWFR
ncbi:alpha-1A adrenergic receptor-like [Xenia sp. Carnegie-2017]|uniref:alpha-1A adrenergic receptor-like n=1 Tax=Xenia sp. Carnegie-2017 TaxID=2897299 RepID=UPI001F04035C|nr:alpha-1A adrenergic receptor-like [Xenia sp. Carnegie-2017]